jgi:hypothetical protein
MVQSAETLLCAKGSQLSLPLKMHWIPTPFLPIQNGHQHGANVVWETRLRREAKTTLSASERGFLESKKPN